MSNSPWEIPSELIFPIPQNWEKSSWEILIHGAGRYGDYKNLVVRSKIEKCKQWSSAAGFGDSQCALRVVMWLVLNGWGYWWKLLGFIWFCIYVCGFYIELYRLVRRWVFILWGEIVCTCFSNLDFWNLRTWKSWKLSIWLWSFWSCLVNIWSDCEWIGPESYIFIINYGATGTMSTSSSTSTVEAPRQFPRYLFGDQY